MSSEHERRRRFEAIVDEVFEPLQRYLRRRVGPADAEDALADVLMTIWRRIEDVPSPPTLPWCYGIARRTLANQRRGRERHLRLVRRIEAQPAPEPGHDPAEAGPDPELSLALDQLGDEDREVLRLWAWEQLEPREIAPVLDISVNAATLRLSRAKKRLAKAMAGQSAPSSGHRQVEGTQESR